MCRVVYSGALALILLSLAVPRGGVAAGVPTDAWLIHAKVAVQIFACGGLLCGRIVAAASAVASGMIDVKALGSVGVGDAAH